MAVVRMKESYIFNIVPNHWALAKMQNRETGELDILHIYELDPLPQPEEQAREEGEEKGDTSESPAQGDDDSGESESENEISPVKSKVDDESNADQTDSSSTNGSEGAKENQPRDSEVKTAPQSPQQPSSANKAPEVKYSYLAIAQRKLELVGRPLLHPYCQNVFGTPLLLRVVDLEGYTGRDLYDLVAKRIRQFVPKAAHSYLLKGRTVPSESSEDADNESAEPQGSRGDDSSARGQPQTRRKRRQGSCRGMDSACVWPLAMGGAASFVRGMNAA